MAELTGKVALVTGGGRGIGRSAAIELARRGAAVAVTARSEAELAEAAEAVRQAGGRALMVAADLADRRAAGEIVARVRRELGPIAILVNNAAMAGPYGKTWEVEPDGWERALAVNLVAPFRLSHAVLPGMREAGWGRILNISSGAARNPLVGTAPYSLTKAALDMLTRQIAAELGEGGISVISVYPGIVDTAMQVDIRSQPPELVTQQTSSRFREFHASGQLQHPDRPGRLIAALAGEAGAAYHGQVVDIYSHEGQRLAEE